MIHTNEPLRLGALANPANFRAPVDLANERSETLMQWLRDMLLIRYAEESVGDWVLSGEAKCPCHLGIGQEAVAVGISAALNAQDRIFGGHRSHPHYLALGGDVDKMFAEILGKQTGASRGMGGSMHLYAQEVGFQGSVPIVGATIPVAVGAGLAAKMDGKGQVAVTYFGDGSCEEGVLHESLNLASVMKLPVIFVCENNLYSSHLDINLRQPSDSVARFAVAHGVRHAVLDGNDVVQMANAARELVHSAREGKGPVFIEAVTYRWRGHVGAREDIDVGVRRSADDLVLWKQRDPIKRLFDALQQRDGLDQAWFEAQAAKIKARIAIAVDLARKAPFPPESALLDFVYAPSAGAKK